MRSTCASRISAACRCVSSETRTEERERRETHHEHHLSRLEHIAAALWSARSERVHAGAGLQCGEGRAPEAGAEVRHLPVGVEQRPGPGGGDRERRAGQLGRCGAQLEPPALRLAILRHRPERLRRRQLRRPGLLPQGLDRRRHRPTVERPTPARQDQPHGHRLRPRRAPVDRRQPHHAPLQRRPRPDLDRHRLRRRRAPHHPAVHRRPARHRHRRIRHRPHQRRRRQDLGQASPHPRRLLPLRHRLHRPLERLVQRPGRRHPAHRRRRQDLARAGQPRRSPHVHPAAPGRRTLRPGRRRPHGRQARRRLGTLRP
eukprot:Opistho-1_new@95568